MQELKGMNNGCCLRATRLSPCSLVLIGGSWVKNQDYILSASSTMIVVVFIYLNVYWLSSWCGLIILPGITSGVISWTVNSTSEWGSVSSSDCGVSSLRGLLHQKQALMYESLEWGFDSWWWHILFLIKTDHHSCFSSSRCVNGRGLLHRKQVLKQVLMVESSEWGFDYRSRHSCSWARQFTVVASH